MQKVNLIKFCFGRRFSAIGNYFKIQNKKSTHGNILKVFQKQMTFKKWQVGQTLGRQLLVITQIQI